METGTILDPNLIASIKQFLVVGTGIFLLIAGLKNVPPFADFFEKFPKLAILVNAALALFAGLGVCLLKTEHFSMIECLLAAIGAFLTAAGVHFVKKSLTPAPRDFVSPAVSDSVRAEAAAEGRK